MSKGQQSNSSALFGFCGGILTSIIFQPFDVVKMSLMLGHNNNMSHRVVHTINNIVKDNGILGLWKGLGVSTIRNASGAGVYFFLLRYFDNMNEGWSFLNSAGARIASSILLNPMTIIQTKVLMPTSTNVKQSFVAIDQMLHYKSEPKTLSKGMLSACLKQGLFAGAYYQIFLALKTMQGDYHVGVNFLNGIIAGLISTAISHPFELARAQIQADIGNNIRGVFKDIYKQQGWQGFFKGVSPRLLRKPIINTITFVLVQKMQYLKEKLNKE